MRTERRCVQRKRPGGISYFEFEAGSGGIVLDASEKGLGFQAADAIHQLGPGRIWISPRPEERIELTGDVVWTDASRKTGGLRFIETGGEGNKKIRNWLGLEESEASVLSQEFPLPAWATQALGDLRPETRHDANLPRSAVAPPARMEVEERPAELHSIPGLPSLFTSSAPWQPQGFSTSGRGAGYRVATGFLIVVLAVAGVVLFNMFRPKVGESLIHLGEKINGTEKVQPQNSSPLPGLAEIPATASPANEAKPDVAHSEGKPDVVQKGNSGDSSLTVDSSKRGNSPSNPAISGAMTTTKEALNRPQDRVARNSRQDRSAEATRLWSAVASGDSSAEVDLARLYLKGEGVPRNCEQARVLLRAAVKAGSAEARQQLRKLRAMGCR